MPRGLPGQVPRLRSKGVNAAAGGAEMPRTLLFDLDGTLTDPRPGFVRSIQHALDRLGAPCPAEAELASFIGPPLRTTFATVLGTTDRALIERAIALYRDRYSEVGLYENEIYDGIVDMLDAVSGQASVLFVATAKPREFAERIVNHFGLGRYFAGVYGAEPGGRFDDKADLLAHLLALERRRAEAPVMVGDRASDIAAARANGVPAIGVLWGYGSEEELIGAGADLLCASPDQLARCLPTPSASGG